MVPRLVIWQGHRRKTLRTCPQNHEGEFGTELQNVFGSVFLWNAYLQSQNRVAAALVRFHPTNFTLEALQSQPPKGRGGFS